MNRSLVTDCSKQIGKKVKVEGHVENIRDHGKITFIDLYDRSGIIQVVGAGDQYRELRPQYVVSIEGTVQKRPASLVNSKIDTGEIELKAEKLDVLTKSQELPFDITKEDLDLELPTLLDFRALTLRHSKQKAIFKVQETVIDSFRKSLQEKDFTEFQSPVIIPQGAEGGAEMFEVNYFDKKAFLAQSPQFYKQILVAVFERVFTVNKTLRAEPSVTTRHLAEVTTLDAEFGFIESWEELMDMAEYVIKFIFHQVEKNNKADLGVWNSSIPKTSVKIPRVTLSQAQEIIYKGTKRDVRGEPDLAPEDERDICTWAEKEMGSELIFITHYPAKKRPFYTYPDPENPKLTLSFDLIGRGVEWLTGGRRITDLEALLKNAKERKIDLEKSELYMQAFKYGMPPEGGFSFGSERITMGILKLSNIREASIFPRDMERVDIRFSKLKKP